MDNIENKDFYKYFNKVTLIKLKRYYKANKSNNEYIKKLKDYVYGQKLLNVIQKDKAWEKIIK